jgi:hypothetical protein
MHKKYSKKDYAIIGEYVVLFERILHNITLVSRSLFVHRGLQQSLLVDVIFGQNNFTGFPKIAAFNSLIVEYMSVFDGDENTKNFILKQNELVYKSLVKHNEYRNTIVHSTYGTYYGGKDIKPKHIAIKIRGKKEGYATEELELDTIKEYIDDLKKLEKEFSKLSFELTFKIENLKFDLRLK